MKKKMIMYVFPVIAVTILSLFSSLPVFAEKETPAADLSVSSLSAYIWRGQELSRDSIVIQPSMTVSYMGFAVNMWGNMDTDPYSDTSSGDENNWNETDFTLSYCKEFGIVSAELGWIYYGLDEAADSQELYLSFGVDTFLSPGLTVYRDTDSYRHTYFLLGISHSFEFTEIVSLELAGSVSYLISHSREDYSEYNSQGVATNERFNDFHDGIISASLPVALGEYFTITPLVSYVFPLSGDAKDEMEGRSKRNSDHTFFYGGVTLGMAF